MRSLTEYYINFAWIGTNRSNKNYALFIIEDCTSMARRARRIADFESRRGAPNETILSWLKIEQINLAQIRQALKLSSLIDAKSKPPKLHARVEEIDRARGGHYFESLYRFEYGSWGNAVHGTQRHLNSMDRLGDGLTYLDGTEQELNFYASTTAATFYDFVAEFNRRFNVGLSLDDFL